MIIKWCMVYTDSLSLTYFYDRGRGPKDIFGSEIWAKRDFLRSTKDAGILFLVTGIFLGFVSFISSNQQYNVQFTAYLGFF